MTPLGRERPRFVEATSGLQMPVTSRSSPLSYWPASSKIFQKCHSNRFSGYTCAVGQALACDKTAKSKFCLKVSGLPQSLWQTLGKLSAKTCFRGRGGLV